MKNKRYRELAAILVMMTMTAGSITTVAAETETTAEEETTAETETDEPETETAEDADSEAAEAADIQSQAAALEVTDRFAQQTAVDEALLQEASNGYSLDEALIVVNPYGMSPLSAVAVFSTEEACGGTVTVKGKSAENDVTGTFEEATEHIVPIYGLYNNDTTEVVITLDDGTSATFEVTTEDIGVDYGTIQTEMKSEASYDYSNLTFVCSTMGTLYGVDAAEISDSLPILAELSEFTSWRTGIFSCLHPMC